MAENIEVAILGNGCFWCTEAVFQLVKGVTKVESGYSGGDTVNPSYKDICTGTTNHAECLRVSYDSDEISYEDILKVFWESHDPTTPNRQGNDVGTQYTDDHQKKIAEDFKKQLNDSGKFKNPIVTSIEPATTFYVAEDYHKNYYNNNGSASYCQFVVRPKVEKYLKSLA